MGTVKVLEKYEDIVGISSLARGADQLFADIVLDRGGHLVGVVPCEKYEETFPNPVDLEKYRQLLKKADQIIQLDHIEPTEDAFWEAGKRVVGMSDILIAVWDGKPGGKGGTADVVAYAESISKPVTVVWIEGLSRR
jgi:hypothetical protein